MLSVGSRPALRAVQSLLWVAAPALVLLSSSSLRAEPQGTAGLTIGVAGAGQERAIWDETLFHLGLHGDVLFGRSKNHDFGVGPYLEVATHAFREVQFGGGVSTLLPVHENYPVVVSLGAYGRKGDDAFGLTPGLAGELFWGSRSFNFHTGYVFTAGLVGQFRYGLGAPRETSVVIAAQLDLMALSLPFLFLINGVRGGSGATAPVRR